MIPGFTNMHIKELNLLQSLYHFVLGFADQKDFTLGYDVFQDNTREKLSQKYATSKKQDQ